MEEATLDLEQEKINRKSKKMKKTKSQNINGKGKSQNGKKPELDKEVILQKSRTAKSNGEKRASYQPSDFKIIKEVGEGSYGRVYLAERVIDGKKWAIKMLDKHHLIKSHKVEHVMREKKILTESTHPNIIEIIGTFQDEDNLYFALSYEENGDLIGMLTKMKVLPIEIIRYYTAQLVHVLQYIHTRGIVHRDLKPQNILISSDFRLKLIDFGDSLVEGANEQMEKPHDDSDDMDEEDKIAREEEDKKQEYVEFRAHEEDVEEDVGYKAMTEYRGTFVGTPLYVAPEMLKESMSGHFTDLWALGCIVYQMATGEVPFKGKTDFQTFDIIMKREFTWPDEIDEDWKDLINRLLVLEPMRRLGAGRPGSGNSYEDLVKHPFFEGINWSTVTTDPIPYDVEKLSDIIKKKPKLDIFDTDVSNDDDISTRQSEVNVVLENEDDFEKLFENSKPIKKGFLLKRNPWFMNQKRLFILTNQPRLMYFKDESNFRGEIPLSKDTEITKVWKYKFEIKTKKRTYYLKHPDKGSIDTWVQDIKDAIKSHFRK